MKLSIPTIASMCVTALYSTADAYFVSQLGTSASGAVGVVFALMTGIQAIGFTLGMGAGSRISRSLGAKDERTANIYGTSAFFFVIAFSAVLCAASLAFLNPLLRLIGSTETILPYSRSYASWILFGAPVMCAAVVMNNVLRAEGHAAFAMCGLVSGGLINIVLDPIFIFGLGMGISGAAAATMLSQTIAFFILLSFFLRGRSIVRISPKYISRKPWLYVDIVRLGAPSLFRQGLTTISTAVLNSTAGLWGDPAVAAMSIVNRIFTFIMAMRIGIGQGFAPVVGYNYGARCFERVRESFRFTIKYAMLVVTPLAVGVWIFAPEILALFRPGDTEVIAIGTRAMRWQCIALLLQPLFGNINMLFQATGFPWRATLIACTRQGIFFMPLIFILPRLFGLEGVEATQAVSDFFSLLFALPFLSWFMKMLNRREAEEEPRIK